MKIICLVSFLLLFHVSKAQDNNRGISINSGYAIDSASKWNLAFAKKQSYKAFRENENINIGYNKYDAVWCYFKIRNTKLEPTKAWLSFSNYHIDSLTLFDKQRIVLIGDRTANRSPFIEALSFELQLDANEEKVLFVRLKKQTSFVEFSYALAQSASLEADSSEKIALVSFFIGIVFLLLMINGILFFMTKNKLYIYYIAYSTLTVIYAAITTNFAKHVLFPDFLLFSEGRVFTGTLWYIALSYFLSYFLNLRTFQPLKYRFITIVSFVNLMLIILSVFLLIFFPDFDFRAIFILGYVTFLAAILVLFWAAIYHLKVERQQAIYALFAFAPQLIWGACLILKTFDVIPKSLGDNWMVFASLYEVFLFGYVLSRNYIAIFLKNNELMKEVILEKESSLKAISEVQLRERRSIANIIHDKVGSKIAHVIHLFDMNNSKLAKKNIMELADDIRDISHRILPKALDEGALVSSLNSQIINLNASLPQTEIELFSYDFPSKVSEEWVYDLYLISLEIINNAVKHGKAKLITIEFYKYTDYYHFQFTDDGLGFDLLKTDKGFGLENIEKRIRYYKGDFEISSIENEGTIIQIDIPAFSI